MCFPCHACLCWHVRLQAGYSLDVIAMANQKWAVLISSRSTPLQQSGGEWIWNKFPVHRCGDLPKHHTHKHTHLAVMASTILSLNFYASLSLSHGCEIVLSVYTHECVCLDCIICIQMRNTWDLIRMHYFLLWTLSFFCQALNPPQHLDSRGCGHVWTQPSLWKQITWRNAAFCSFIWLGSPYCVDLWAYTCFERRVVFLTRKWLMENLFLFFLLAPRHKIHQSEHDTSSFPGWKVWRELQIHSEVSGWTGTRGGSQQRYDHSVP